MHISIATPNKPVCNQLPRFVCSVDSIEAQIPKAKLWGVLLYCIQSEGLVDDCFLAHCFCGCNKHVSSSQELYERLPSPSETKHIIMDMNPTRRICIASGIMQYTLTTEAPGYVTI
jgi:hypothetical protein